MRPFVYRCPSTDIPVITQLYAGMFLDGRQFPFPYPCPCGHLHSLEIAEEKVVVTDTRGELPPAITPLLPMPAKRAHR